METRTIVLNLQPRTTIQAVNVSQYDVGVPLRFIIYDGSSPANLSSVTSCKIQMTRPSGMAVTETCQMSGNVVTKNTTLDMTREAGDIEAELRFIAGTTNVGTCNFTLAVEPAAQADDAIEADTEALREIAQEIHADVAQNTQSATIASQSASSAQEYASSAQHNAEVATAAATSAGTASSRAVEAARQAALDAQTASQSAQDVVDGVEAAQAAATIATNKATIATNKASEAATSATQASNYASSANTSATSATSAKDVAISAMNAAANSEAAARGAKASAEAYASQASDSADRAEAAAQSLVVDNTLTQQGQAADAYKTGLEITGLKDDLNANTKVDLMAVELTSKTILTTNNGYGIETTGAGAAYYTSCKIQRYTVTPGELLFLKIAASESPVTYVFKSSNYAVVTNNVGLAHIEPVNKFVLVPDGATHLFVSFAMADTISDVCTVKSTIDTLKMGLFNKDARIALLACLEHVAWVDGNGKTYYDTLKSYLIEEEPIVIEPIIPTFEIGGTVSTNKQLRYTNVSTRAVHNPIAYKLKPGTYDIEINYTGDYYYSVLLFNYDEEEYPNVDFTFTQGTTKTFIPEQKTTQYWSFSSWSKTTKTITVTEDYPFLNFQFKNGSAGTTNFTQSDIDLMQNNVVIRYKGE